MAYFGGKGVSGRLHPSLQAYSDCCSNPIVGKGWPRGGGLWDQNPVLVAHFRVIAKYEREWKEHQEAVHGSSGSNVSEALDKYISEQGESTSLL